MSGEDPACDVPGLAADACREDDCLVDACAASDFPGADFPGADFPGADFPAEAGLACPAPPFIEAPQNGHSTASSSSTDCLHAGHVGRSMLPRTLCARCDFYLQNTALLGKTPAASGGRLRIEGGGSKAASADAVTGIPKEIQIAASTPREIVMVFLWRLDVRGRLACL
jgi:hypothetical protein